MDINKRDRNYILIVDDSQATATLTSRFLEKRGYRTKIAATVSDASYIIGHEDVGTILLDFHLAGINDGIVLIERIRKFNFDLNVFAASSSEENNMLLLSAGCDGIISNDIENIKLFFCDMNENV